MSKVEDDILTSGMFNSDLEIKDIQYDPLNQPNSQRAIDVAATEGLNVIFPKDNELQVDIDNEHSFFLFEKQRMILNRFVPIRDIRIEPSRSGLPKRHITVTLVDPVSQIERLALQAMLGSDRVRELLGYVQHKNNDPHPILFLEKRCS